MPIETLTSAPDNGHGLTTIRNIPRYVWISESSVDYDTIPSDGDLRPSSSNSEPLTDWDSEVVCNFGIDSGVVCLLSKYAFWDIIITW